MVLFVNGCVRENSRTLELAQAVLESISDIYGKEFVTKDTALLHRNITTTIPLTNWDVSLTAIQLAMRLEVEEMKDTVRINRLENK